MTRLLLASDEATVDALPASVQTGMALAVVALVATAGIMSGLTLGLLSLDRLDLEVMLRTGNKKQQKFATRLFPMVEQPHWVLSTLVITNTVAGMALPLCLDRLVNVAVALVLSTTAVVLFGEIIPQALCTRYGLSIGGHAAPAVRVLMWITCPISWPIAKALDAMLGKENFVFGKRQIRAFVDLHRESAGMGGPLNEEEFHVIQGVLDLGKKKAFKAMTPLEKVFMLSTDDILDRPTLRRILDTGHSRIPVYRGTDRDDIVGLILVKELLAVVGLAPPGSGPMPITALKMRDLPALPVETPMTDLLNLFQTGHSHMALLLDTPGRAESRRASTYRPSSTNSSFSSRCSSSSDGTGSSSSSSSDAGEEHTGTPKSSRSHRVKSLLQCLSSKRFRLRSKSHDSSTEEVASPTAAAAAGQHESALPGQQSELADVSSDPSAATERISHLSGGHSSSERNGAADVTAPNHPDQVVIDIGAGTQDSSAATAAPVGGPDSSHWKITAIGPHAAVAAAAAAAVAADNSGAGKDGSSAGSHHQDIHHSHANHIHDHLRGPHQTAATSATAAAATSQGCSDVPFHGHVPVGIITLEDVLEELMQEEIVDETDTFIDNEKTCRVNARVLAMSLPPAMRRLLLASQQHHVQHWPQQQQPISLASPSGATALARVSPQIFKVLASKSFPLSGS